CALTAVLRDYARLGLLLAHDGNWRGRQIIPAAWIREASTVRPEQPYLAPRAATRFFGYGYQTWIFPDEPPLFALLAMRALRVSAATAIRPGSSRTSPGCSRSSAYGGRRSTSISPAGSSWSTPPCASCRSIRPAPRRSRSGAASCATSAADARGAYISPYG